MSSSFPVPAISLARHIPRRLRAQVSELTVATDETARQTFLLDTYLSHDVPLLMVGPTGTGKSAITNSFLVGLPRDRYVLNTISFSARTTAGQTQDIVMSKLDRWAPQWTGRVSVG